MIKDSIAIRQKMNREIVLLLLEKVEEYPNMRFSQIVFDMLPNWRKEALVNANDLCNVFYNEEPAIHLARLTKE